jgi:hypothetical protein
MTRKDSLLDKAKYSPNNLRFQDLCKLAELYGFKFRRSIGTSHKIYSHPKVPKLMNFQNDHGKAKPYQVRELLDAIEEYELKENNYA